MKPFNLGCALAGDPFVLVQASEHDIIPVRFVGELTDGRVVVERRAESGVYYVEVCRDEQLRMAPIKRTVYINLHKQRDSGEIVPYLYEDQRLANNQRGSSMNCLGTFAIEIED
ncbi:hypothetical protein [Paraburkholderia caffeinilytica]|uniref:hypothetical protein n=1 Tax=Paraburkholderia caffeinilytica TaxID=1761016 RepID=UPI0038BB4644